MFRVLAGAAQLGALYLATHAIGTAVGWKVMADAEPSEPPEAPAEDEDEDEDEDAPSKPKPKTLEYAKRTDDPRQVQITQYNAFCPSCAPAEDVEDALGLGPDAPAIADMEFPDAVRTQLPLALVATMEAEAPGISLATISYADSGGTGVFAEGDEVLDDVTLLSVDLGLVYLRTPTRVEFLPLSSGQVPAPKPPPTTKDEGKEPKPNKYAVEGAADAIKCTENSNGQSCTVERQFVAQLLANPAVLTTQARTKPYDKYGVQGFQLSRVRKGSIPYMLGIRSGNVIKAINGHELKSLDGAMKLYTQLRSASHLSVDYVQGSKGKLYEKRLEVDII
ncbi:MAG: hypothetical protein KDK70_37130 [Myxococcales bacterium]|nr:hypothetical protein [Myxococcales bacterium]